jgi:hypothetical protein
MLKSLSASLTLPRLVVAITFMLIFAMAARVSLDTDTWWHLRTGQWIVEHRAVPAADPFSYTRAGADWRIPGWIVQAPLYLLFASFSYAGLNLFTAFFVTLTFALVYRACSGPPLLRAFALVLAVAVSAIYWSARPQIVSFALAGAFAWVLYDYRERAVNRLWLLPPLMALWANAHGGFAIGFILIGLTLAGEAISLGWRWLSARFGRLEPPASNVQRPSSNPRPLLWLAAVGLLCALAVMLNPAGPEMLLYPFKTVSIGALRDFIQEWQSPNFHQRETQPFLWLLIGTLVVVVLSRRPANFTDLLLVSGLGYMGFLAGRNMPLLAIVAPPLLTRHASELLDDLRARFLKSGGASGGTTGGVPAINWLLLIVIGALALVKVISVLPAQVNEQQIERLVPVKAAQFILRERPPGPLFNSYNFGAYLMWALYPDYPVYTDGRTDLYDDAFLREYLDVAVGRPAYEQTFERYGVRLVLVEADSLLGDRLSEDPDWRLLYRDELAAVYGWAEP